MSATNGGPASGVTAEAANLPAERDQSPATRASDRERDGVLQRVQEAAAGRQTGEWIRVVGGWHSRQLRENRLPTRAELDAAD